MTTTIATSRLLLRPLTAQDLPALVRGLNNFAVSRWTARIPFPYGLRDAEDYLVVASRHEEGTLRLSITCDDGLIGGITYERNTGDGTELGYWLAESHWGKGFGTEAARAMTDHAFEAAGHDLLVARYAHGNEASRRILAGLGFRTTGESPCHSLALAAEAPATRMELTRDGWQAARGVIR